MFCATASLNTNGIVVAHASGILNDIKIMPESDAARNRADQSLQIGGSIKGIEVEREGQPGANHESGCQF